MPIDESEWNNTESPTASLEQIRIFLRRNPDKAYTVEEIAEEIQGIEIDHPNATLRVLFMARLDMLVELGDIEERAITEPDDKDRDFEVYYRTASR